MIVMLMDVMLLGVKGGFRFGLMWRDVYIERLCQDARYGGGRTMGKLKQAMYGTCEAPQI